MPYTQWLPIAITTLIALFCFGAEVQDYMASKRRKKKGLNVTNTPRNPYANLNYDWEGNDEWYGHWWPKQDEVLEDIRKAIERSKQLNSNTTQEGVVNATAQ
jgi:hypothetical protein